jgi:hypothetical protein
MKNVIIILLLLFSCGSPVQRFEETPTKLQPIVKVEPENPQIESVVDDGEKDWVFIRSVQAKWKVSNQDGETYDDYCVYEFYYSENRNKFELRMEGYLPKNHSAYKGVAKILGNVNKATLKGKSVEYRIGLIEGINIEGAE